MPPFTRDQLYPQESFAIDNLPDLTPPEPVVPPDMAPYRPDLASGPHTAFPISAPGVMRGDQPPMLTNIPQTAESAAGQGADVYFLSDTPQTEQFLKTGEPKPYKYVLHDVPGPRPSESQMSLTDAWKDFSTNEFSKQFGFDPNKVNPGEMGQKAYDKYIQDNIGHLAPQQVGLLDPKYLKSIYSVADKQRTEGNRIGVGMLRQADQIRQLFARDFLQKRAIANRPQGRERMISAVDPGTGKTIYVPESKAVGMNPPTKETKEPTRQPVPVWDEEKQQDVWYAPWDPELHGQPIGQKARKAEVSPDVAEEKLKQQAVKNAQKNLRWEFLSDPDREKLVAREFELLKKPAGELAGGGKKGKLVPNGQGGFVYTR
jgi:hypothetical protein